jgi:predicted house-cleaning NTP pyrophosphatase (Maf/HAM1 superfamily)
MKLILASASTRRAKILPAILTAVESHAMGGNISDSLRRVFGEYQESVII